MDKIYKKISNLTMIKPLLAVLLFLFYGLNTQAQNNTIETSGDVLLYALPLTTLATTIVLKDGKGAGQFSKGFLLNIITTEALKLVISKERPNGFDNKSFPSGHTSVTFQSAAFIQKRYGWKFGAPAYLLAAYTGYSRVQSDNHYFIDVLAGAALGIGSSYIFTTKYTQGIQVSVVKDNFGTSLVLKLDF
ncbi:phosphatase PAP2 family protein [Flavobacterium gelidilacus]|uniref:phosphatase PAP2 family protein n=1 Tax=Flavobacterium gelidilacus TaxID=206041 RepID=UPI000400F0D2|nr:phosphatase PAP2 family protein [Flavobacterium gelidilacus]